MSSTRPLSDLQDCLEDISKTKLSMNLDSQSF